METWIMYGWIYREMVYTYLQFSLNLSDELKKSFNSLEILYVCRQVHILYVCIQYVQ